MNEEEKNRKSFVLRMTDLEYKRLREEAYLRNCSMAKIIKQALAVFLHVFKDGEKDDTT